jgi:predicted nuclease with TOPRIM domain
MKLSDKEYQAIQTIAKYQFYKEYVEPLEAEYDKLLDEVIKLKKENRKLKKKIGFNVQDYERLRKQNLELTKKLNRRVM